MTAGEIKAILEKLEAVCGAACLADESEFNPVAHIVANDRFVTVARTALPALRTLVERLHGLRIEGLQVVYKADVDRIIADALAPLKELL